MLSDTLFEISCSLAEELQECGGYSAECLKEVLESWMQLEKIRIKLDRSPLLPELSPEESTVLAKSAISSYFKQEESSQKHLEKVF